MPRPLVPCLDGINVQREKRVTDRGIRSLVHLQNSASTARVLNLLSTWHRHKDKPEFTAQPFFQNSRLNRAMILKHRLRQDELDLFDSPRLTATKIVFPLDPKDLKFGGRFAFIGQKNFDYLLEDVIGKNPKNEALDLPLLKLLDELPSLDPFLIREELKRNGYQPAGCYLELSEADLKRIFAFVQSEIEPLVRMSLGGQTGLAGQTARLVEKILSNTLDLEMQPLRQVLRLNEAEFAEGIFCWKGFLYYKWVYGGIAEKMPQIVHTVVHTNPMGRMDANTRATLERVRTVLVDRIMSTSNAIKTSLDNYDSAYLELTKNANPLAFRDFLLKSPALFVEIGERLGVLQHLTSFCLFRFPPNRRASIGVEELLDIFNDFEANLYTVESQPQTTGTAAA
jgi:hypothetical protein